MVLRSIRLPAWPNFSFESVAAIGQVTLARLQSEVRAIMEIPL